MFDKGCTPYTIQDDFTIDLSQCGSSRGCFRRPSGCADDDCTVAASWTRPAGASYVEIELVGKQEGWIALGFSEDNRMVSTFIMIFKLSGSLKLKINGTTHSLCP